MRPPLSAPPTRKRDRRSAVVGAVGAVDVGGTAEFGGQHHHSIAPGRTHVCLDRSKGVIERAKQLRQAPLRNAFVEMRIPAIERQRADTRPVGLRQKFCSRAGGLGEIGAHLRGSGTSRFLRHVAGLLDRGHPGVVFQHAGELHIGVAVEIEQALHRIGTGGRRALR